MLILFVITGFLLAWSLAAGLLMLCRHGEITGTLSFADRVLLAAWTGFLGLSALNLALSAVIPLSPLALLLECVVVLVLAAANRDVRNVFAGLLSRYRTIAFTSAVMILMFASFMGGQIIVNRDGFSYQFDLIQHLSRIGSAPGLALLHNRYGFTSIWFTIPALLNHGFMTARIASIANTYILALSLLHIFLSLRKIISGGGRFTDWIAFPMFTIALIFPVLINMPASPSHDFPVVLLTAAVTWMICLREESLRTGSTVLATPIPAGLPLFIGVLAVTVKMSALPIALVGGLYFLFTRPGPIVLIKSSLICILLALPLIISSVMISGHWLYPLPPEAPVPWALGHQWAEVESLIVKNYAKWGAGTIPEEARNAVYLSRDWLAFWVRQDSANAMALAAFLCTIIALPLWTFVRITNRRFLVWPLLMGVSGTAFLLIMAPASRFGWGYLTIIPSAMAGAILYGRMKPGTVRNPVWASAILLIIPVVFAAGGQLLETKSEKRLHRAIGNGEITLTLTHLWLQPSVIPLIKFIDKEDRAYELCDHRGANDLFRVFDRPPYYAADKRIDIELRDSARGPRGGYQRTEAWTAPDPANYR